LLKELAVIGGVISEGGTDKHVVLIDDRRIFKTDSWFPVTEELIMKSLTSIFSRHTIRYLPGFIPDDIIAAFP